MKRAIILPSLVTAFVALSPVGVALADNPHTDPRQHRPTEQGGQSKTPTLKPPGFSTDGFANAEQHYAGSELNPNRRQHRQGREPIRRRRLPVGAAPPGDP